MEKWGKKSPGRYFLFSFPQSLCFIRQTFYLLWSFSCDCSATGDEGPCSIISLHHPLPAIIFALAPGWSDESPDNAPASESSLLFCSIKVCTLWHCGYSSEQTHSHIHTLSHTVARTHTHTHTQTHTMKEMYHSPCTLLIAELLLTNKRTHTKNTTQPLSLLLPVSCGVLDHLQRDLGSWTTPVTSGSPFRLYHLGHFVRFLLSDPLSLGCVVQVLLKSPYCKSVKF